MDPVVVASLAILDQQLEFLSLPSVEHFELALPHLRHTSDHFHKAIAGMRFAMDRSDHSSICSASGEAGGVSLVEYDRRERGTKMEQSPVHAKEAISTLRHELLHTCTNPRWQADTRIRVSFMMSSDAKNPPQEFNSTFSRELAFAVHHAIHHNAYVRLALQHTIAELPPLPPDFGLAPATAAFQQRVAAE